MKFLVALMLAVASAALAQQPQTPDQPIVDVNARITNGVGPGYWITKQATGLVMNLSSGTTFCSGSIIEYAGGTLTMSPSTTNYVYLNTAASCAPAVKTAVFSSSDIPIAIVGTATSSVTTVDDVRTMFFAGGGGGGSNCVPTSGGGPYPTPSGGFGELVYLTNSGTGCASDTNLITDGNTLWMKEGGNIEMDAPSPRDGDEYSLLDADHWKMYSSTGNGGTPGIHMEIDDSDASVGGGIGGGSPINISAAFVHNPPTASWAVIDILSAVGGADKPTNTFNDIMLESSSGGAKVRNFHGLEIQMNGAAATVQESGIHNTVNPLIVTSNYCDYLSEDIDGGTVVVRAALGCDTDRHSNFGGDVTVPKLKVVGPGASYISAVPVAATTCPTPLAGTLFLCADYVTQAFQISNSGAAYFTIGAGGGSSAFSSLTSGTNNTAAMQVGTGASITPIGTGTIQATTVANNTLLPHPGASSNFVAISDSIGLKKTSSYPETLAANLGIPIGNQLITAIGGASLPDILSCVTVPGCSAGGAFPYQDGVLPLNLGALGITANTKSVLGFGFNDLSNTGVSPTVSQLDYFYGQEMAYLMLLGIPDSQKINPNTACTVTGTSAVLGSPYPVGTVFLTSNGANVVCTGQQATFAGILVGKDTASTAVFTVSVNNSGTTYNLVDANTGFTTMNRNAGTYTTAYAGTKSLQAIGQSGLPGGYTTVTATCTNIGNGGCVFSMPFFLSTSTTVMNQPSVVQMLTPFQNQGGACGGCITLHTDAQINQFRTKQVAAVNMVRSNGLNVTYFDPNASPNGVNPNTAADMGGMTQYTVAAGGSGYATGAMTFSGGGCTILPTATAALSGGVITTGTFYPTTAGACTSAPTITFTGGGSGATATGVYLQDSLHFNIAGGNKVAALAQYAFNSADNTVQKMPAPSYLPTVTTNKSYTATSTQQVDAVGYAFSGPGVLPFNLAAWTTNNGAGLSGALGLFDGSAHFVWSTNSSDDLYGFTPITNVVAGTGAAWSILHTGVASFAGLGSTGAYTNTFAPTASTSAATYSGALLTGGTGTTNFPHWYINQGTAPTTWSTSGTMIGLNAPTGFGGNFLDFHLNGGGSIFKVGASGALTSSSSAAFSSMTLTSALNEAMNTIAFSATPVLSINCNTNYIILTGNVTSSTIAAGANGQKMTVMIAQDATGSRTWTWPANVRGGGTIGSTLSTISVQNFVYNTSLAQWVAVEAILTGI